MLHVRRQLRIVRYVALANFTLCGSSLLRYEKVAYYTLRGSSVLYVTWPFAAVT